MRVLRIFFLFAALLYLPTIFAVPAYPYPVKITQADGTTLTVVKRGDEFFHYHESEDGYLLTKNTKGVFNYAKLDISGEIVDTKIKANNPNERKVSEKAFLSRMEQGVTVQSISTKMRSKRNEAPEASSPQRAFPLQGSPRSLVILVNFADLEFKVPDPHEAFYNMLNEPGYSANGGTGSARDYFIDNSMGRFNPNFDVVGPYTLPRAMEFYGANNKDGNDKDPVQMVVDACTLAHEDGVDFSIYDTDNDKKVDNIFIYYAGHNEAEWANENTIWPHRWGVYPISEYGSSGNYSGSVSSITFNGVRIIDYACTSEFRGKSGTDMAGIGTFVHEFGHVLGLPDFYATNGATHHTLSSWSVMDGGVYLNQGKTPPAYNAFERFQLNFLTPELLSEPVTVEMNSILLSNEAYLISPTEAHNFSRTNPNPNEYFLLENRQKTGWDSYLPGHGLIIYRINFNWSKYSNNTINNEPNNMGVDIMEADGIASSSSLSGDPFPGTSKKTEYTPRLRNSTVLNDQKLTFIKEENNLISFRYKGGNDIPTVRVVGSPQLFNTVHGTPSSEQVVRISGERLKAAISLSFSPNIHFEMKWADEDNEAWTKTLSIEPTDSVVEPKELLLRYNPDAPSYQYTHTTSLSLASTGADNVHLGLIGKSSRPVYITTPSMNDATNISYGGFSVSWDNVDDAKGYYLNLYEFDTDNNIFKVHTGDLWVEENSYDFYYLISGRTYEFDVRASDKNDTYKYENITAPSQRKQVKLLDYPSNKVLRVVVNNSNLHVFVPKIGDTVNIFNLYGQRVKTIVSVSDIVDVSDLPRKQIYIVQVGKRVAKIIL